MPRRAAKVTEAEIRRAIRALKHEGFEILRVVLTADGASIEGGTRPAKQKTDPAQDEDHDVVIL